MNIEINPEETGGDIFVPPSKSVTHRAIFAASLANGTSRIKLVMISDDIRATIEAAKVYGARFKVLPEEEEEGLFTFLVEGTNDPKARNALIDCQESASTLRFVLPIVALDAENTVITGRGRLSKRPLKPYFDIFDEQGFDYEKGDDGLPLILNGRLSPGVFKLPGDVSSQFVTGLLFALPLLDGDSEILLTTKLESKPYINLTIEILNEFGIDIDWVSDKRFLIKGGQSYRPSRISIKGDFSQAAYWFTNGVINGPTTLKNLDATSTQGDFEIINILREAGANITCMDRIREWVSEPSKTNGFRVDVSDIPDLVPILAVAAALSEGETELYHAKRLRFKESDRIESTTKMLQAFGVEVTETDDGVRIIGTDGFKAAEIDSYNDHRIAIAAAIASGRADGPVIVKNAQCVTKSYPNFWNDFSAVGGNYHGIDMGE